jgi:signal transduction histidine kinase
MRGRGVTWWVFAACAGVVLAVLTLITRQTLALERRDALAGAAAARQDRLRLALWRMDSAMAGVIAREAGHAYFEYRALVPIARPYELRWDRAAPDEPVMASPLVDGDEGGGGVGGVVLRFEIDVDPDGTWGPPRSPEAPEQDELARLIVLDPHRAADAARVAAARTRLGAVERSIVPALREDQRTRARLWPEVAGNADSAPRTSEETLARAVPHAGAAPATAAGPQAVERGDPEQGADADFAARREVAKAAAAEPAPQRARAEAAVQGAMAPYAALGDDGPNQLDPDTQSLESVEVGPFGAAWALPEDTGPRALVLARRVGSGDRQRVQGVWLDWPRVREHLLGTLALTPTEGDTVRIEPNGWALGGNGDAGAFTASGRLATLPADVLITPANAALVPAWTPARTGLVISWAALLAALAAIALVLREAIRLSDRRGMFVTAVTHELRTPLTTFRMYSQMLADGMVSDERVRAEYLDTLKQESGRLAGIVENVLAYARLGTSRGRGPRAAAQRMRPEELLARVRPLLSRRAAQGGMDLVVTAEFEGLDGGTLAIDPAAAERILTNLVDNACRYAGPGEGREDADTRIHLDVRVARGAAAGTLVEMLVADHGPGIAPEDRVRIFGEFRRGRGGASVGGGLGLGLALSRGLAREAGGDLVLARRRGHGAEFLLTLPLLDAQTLPR